VRDFLLRLVAVAQPHPDGRLHDRMKRHGPLWPIRRGLGCHDLTPANRM
jgi:hypothetical protein